MARPAKPLVKKLRLDGESRSPSRNPDSSLSIWFSNAVAWDLMLCRHGVLGQDNSTASLFFARRITVHKLEAWFQG